MIIAIESASTDLSLALADPDGSVIALDASGSHWPAYGSTHQYVRELEVVLSDGQIVRLSRHQPDASASRQDNPAGFLAAGVADVIDRYRHDIDQRTTRSLVDRSGYRLHGIERAGEIDLAEGGYEAG